MFWPVASKQTKNAIRRGGNFHLLLIFPSLSLSLSRTVIGGCLFKGMNGPDCVRSSTRAPGARQIERADSNTAHRKRIKKNDDSLSSVSDLRDHQEEEAHRSKMDELFFQDSDRVAWARRRNRKKEKIRLGSQEWKKK